MEEQPHGPLFDFFQNLTTHRSKDNMLNKELPLLAGCNNRRKPSKLAMRHQSVTLGLPKSSSEDNLNKHSLNFDYISPQRQLNNLKDDLKLLDEIASCPVCLERLRASVVCCVNGHAVCGNCRGKLTQCPTCCLAFSKDKFTVLSQLLEALPQYCQHGGCNQVSKSIQEHEAWCGFRPVQCRQCDFKGAVKALKLHVCSHFTNIHQVSTEKEWCLSLDGSKNQSMYITAHNQLFWLVQNYVPEEAKLVIELTWVPDGLINHDLFEMEARFEKDVRKFKSVTIVHFEPSSDDVSAHFVFHQEMLQCFTENGSIKYKFFISIHS